MRYVWGLVALALTVVGLVLVNTGSGLWSAVCFVLASVATARAFVAWADADRE